MLFPVKRILISSAVITTVVMIVSKQLNKPSKRKIKPLLADKLSRKQKKDITTFFDKIQDEIPDFLFIKKTQDIHYRMYVKELNKRAKKIMNK